MSTIEGITAEQNEIVESWARYTANDLMKSIRKRGIGYSNALYNSIRHKLITGVTGDFKVQHTYNYYGKFVDMGVGRGQRISDVKGNADLRGIVGGGRRPKKWLSKTYYGEVSTLTSILQKHGVESAQSLVVSELNKILT